MIRSDDQFEALALEIATNAHKGQTDKAGKPYILHPIRVAERCHTANERIVALLHDTIEDTCITADYLSSQGFPGNIVNAVLSVTRNDGESYEAFIRRCALDPIGRKVKIHDLEDNLDIKRLPEIADNDLPRINKYLKAYRYLCLLD